MRSLAPVSVVILDDGIFPFPPSELKKNRFRKKLMSKRVSHDLCLLKIFPLASKLGS